MCASSSSDSPRAVRASRGNVSSGRQPNLQTNTKHHSYGRVRRLSRRPGFSAMQNSSLSGAAPALGLLYPKMPGTLGTRVTRKNQHCGRWKTSVQLLTLLGLGTSWHQRLTLLGLGTTGHQGSWVLGLLGARTSLRG